MKALMYTAPRKLEVQDVPKPTVGTGEVLLQVLACGICGSDVHGYLGENGRRIPPMVMGHEFTAKVAETGSGCETLNIGDVVVVQPNVACFECDFCNAGRENLCPHKRVYGVFDFNGAMQEFLAVPERLCIKLPAGLDYKAGSLTESFAVSYSALKKAGDLSGKSILIIGAGTIGLLAMLAAKIQNPSQIAVCDLSDERLRLATEMGADVAEKPPFFDDKQFDVTIEAVGIAPTANLAVKVAKHGGTAVWIGNNQRMIEVNMQDIVTREIKVCGTYIYNFREFGEALLLLEDLNLEQFLNKVIAVEEAADIFAQLAENADKYLKVIINF